LKRAVQLLGPGEIRREGLVMRRMVLADVAPVMELENRAFRHPWSEALFRRELQHDWSTILLAFDRAEGRGDLLLGFVIVWVVHDELHILNVAVDPPHRRRGVARALLEEVLDRARQLRSRLATLEVRRSNEAAQQLYLSLGFRAVGVRPNYYADEGEDAIVMNLDL
jgi:ribosomal-protein-alanine N-acetyltransferase